MYTVHVLSDTLKELKQLLTWEIDLYNNNTFRKRKNTITREWLMNIIIKSKHNKKLLNQYIGDVYQCSASTCTCMCASIMINNTKPKKSHKGNKFT